MPYVGIEILEQALVDDGRHERAAILRRRAQSRAGYRPIAEIRQRLPQDQYDALHTRGAAMHEPDIVDCIRAVVAEITRATATRPPAATGRMVPASHGGSEEAAPTRRRRRSTR